MKLTSNNDESAKAPKMLEKIKKFVESEDGPTAVEYAVMLALIIAVCLIAITTVGQSTSNAFNDSAREIDSFFN